MNRRDVLRGAVALSVSAPAAIGFVAYDPLLSKIREYQRGLDEFNRLAGDLDNDECNALADRTYGPHLDHLSEWKEPATTFEGAMEALRISLTDDGGVYGCEAAQRMVEAALGYLETLRT